MEYFWNHRTETARKAPSPLKFDSTEMFLPDSQVWTLTLEEEWKDQESPDHATTLLKAPLPLLPFEDRPLSEATLATHPARAQLGRSCSEVFSVKKKKKKKASQHSLACF